MIYPYVRTSKGALGEAEQRQLLQAQTGAEVFVEDGSRKGQPVLDHLIATLRSGDIVIVTSLDRLASSLPQLLSVLATCMTKGVHVRSIKENADTGRFSDFADEVSNLLQFALASQQAFLVERVQEGRANVMRKGVKLGRRNKMTPDQVQHARSLLDLGESGRAVARTFGISEATLYRNIRNFKNSKDIRIFENV